MVHANKWQEFADRGGGSRSSGTKGYNLSVDYVYNLAKTAGYNVIRQGIPSSQWELYSQSLKIGDREFTRDDFIAFTNSPATVEDGIKTNLVFVPPGESGPGCSISDYADLNVTGQAVLIACGTCPFTTKCALAKEAGAAAVIIYNNIPHQGAFSSLISFDLSDSIPMVSIGLENAQPYIAKLNQTSTPGEPVTVALKIDSAVRDVSDNIIAQTTWGNQSNVIHIGSHLDSVPAGPGLNDNGSGSATVAELLVQLAKFKPSNNAVRFSWWVYEGENQETGSGSSGSQGYVDSLSEDEKKIAFYINLDMPASPNYIYGIHDGDDSSGENGSTPPPGSGALEKLFQDDFEAKRLPWIAYPFNFGSDYQPFLDAGIPVGGLATGASDIKSESEAVIFGGHAGVPYDTCYHATCDKLDNLAHDAFLVNARSVAHVIATAAESTAAVDVEKAAGAAKSKVQTKRTSGGFIMRLDRSCGRCHQER
ncbi:aminopeptidase Y [Rhizoctonia solani]|uniref:Peptide hydrolase n=1 Tax=Rhizoctonia solani TaxID=456999 RepID=A0A0K6GCR8_9AGAM|nr:aminopeptidase Y [Rhizoctonia solani]